MAPDGFTFYHHIGLIPADWKVHNANDVCLKITDGTHDTPIPTKSGIPYIKSIHIKKGRVEFEKCLFLDIKDHNVIYKRCNPQQGDLLIVNIGAGNVGDYAYVDVEYEFSMKNVALLKPNSRLIDSRYLYQYYQSIKDKVVQSTKTGGAQPFLSLTDLKCLKIVTPPITEQKKIAKILSTWDRAIDVTEKLLSNSQQQKKSLMQQLLTGKKRFPGFNGEWKNRHLSTIAEVIVSPVDKKTIEDEVAIELCNYKDVYYNTRITKRIKFMKATATESEIKRYSLQVGDVLITKDSETPGDIAIPALVSEDLNGVVCGYHLAIIRPNRLRVEGAFLNYLFSMPSTRYYFFTLATGATRFGLSVGGINKAYFRIPDLAEQQKIASILSTVDVEIEALQQKLYCLKQEKKALMQQLLTGKRRVKVDEKEISQKEAARA